MTYDQVLDFLYSQLPMYQRVGAAAYKHDLGKTLDLDKHSGHPHKNFKSVHIAGTNGKGSVAHSVASILQEAGYKTGLYTSPHYLDFRERIRINGQMIPKQYVVDFVSNNMNYFKQLKPSFFEMTVALAFQYFSDQNVDIAVIEVGMGGRLDSTNIITPLVSVITNISFDHTRFLGDTLTKIAEEKAGIIKPYVPVVLGQMQPFVRSVFLEKATEKNAPLYLANHTYSVENINRTAEGKLSFNVYKKGEIAYPNMVFGLAGNYQQLNIPVILKTVDILRQKGYDITDRALYKGMENVVENTGIMGRWQILGKNPLIIADAGHNEDGIRQVTAQIKLTPHKNLHFILGMVNDKDIHNILRLLPRNATYYFTRSSVARSRDGNQLMNEARSFDLKGQAYDNVPEAIDAAIKNAGKDDLVFIGGSTFVVADAIKYLKEGK